MAKLSTATEHALSIVAHALMAQNLSSNVDGFIGFYDFWLKQQTQKDREIIDAFFKLSVRARKDLANMLSRDIKAG